MRRRPRLPALRLPALLIIGIVALFAVPLGLRMNATDQPEGETYAGTDATAEEVVSELDPQYRPWFSPLYEPSSAEVESGLFALQAALGAGGFGFVLGRLSGRRRPGAAEQDGADQVESQPTPGEPLGPAPGEPLGPTPAESAGAAPDVLAVPTSDPVQGSAAGSR